MGEAFITRRGGSGSSVNNLLFYDNGNENTDLTGGWVEGYSLLQGTSTKTLTKNSDNLQIYLTSGTAGQSYEAYASYVTDKRVDLTGISKIRVTWSCTSSVANLAFCELQIVNSKTAIRTDIVETKTLTYVAPFTTKTDELDVYGINNQYYVRVLLGATNGRIQTQNVYKVWGEA